MKNATDNMALRVVVTGSTEWHSEELRSVPVFGRGSRTKRCAIKDAAGKPAARASRFLAISVVCADGVVYRFDYAASMHGSPGRTVRVHGQAYDVANYQDVPAAIEAAHVLAARRCRAMLRIMRVQVAALPAFRPLPVAKVAA